MDLTQSYGAPPSRGVFPGHRRSNIRRSRTTWPLTRATWRSRTSPAELDALLPGDTPILIHAIEGGFQVGAEPVEVRRKRRRAWPNWGSRTRRSRTCSSVTSRTNRARPLPFLPDWVYNRVFHQAHGEGLTELGRELVHALIDVGILVDITHMRSESITDVFELLDQRDPMREIPVIATHMAYRFGGLEYSFDDATVTTVAERGGPARMHSLPALHREWPAKSRLVYRFGGRPLPSH